MKTKATKNVKGSRNRAPDTRVCQPFSWNDFESSILDTDEDVVMKHPGLETDLLDTDEDVVRLHYNIHVTHNETKSAG